MSPRPYQSVNKPIEEPPLEARVVGNGRPYGKDREIQRALMQFFAPENYTTVRRALIDAGRRDLIGRGRDCLIPDSPPKNAGKRPTRPEAKTDKSVKGYRSSARNRR